MGLAGRWRQWQFVLTYAATHTLGTAGLLTFVTTEPFPPTSCVAEAWPIAVFAAPVVGSPRASGAGCYLVCAGCYLVGAGGRNICALESQWF